MDTQFVSFIAADIGFVLITILTMVYYIGRKVGKIDQHTREIRVMELALSKHLDKSQDIVERLTRIETKVDMTISKS